MEVFTANGKGKFIPERLQESEGRGGEVLVTGRKAREQRMYNRDNGLVCISEKNNEKGGLDWK